MTEVDDALSEEKTEIKVGEKIYTAAEIEQLEKDKTNLQADYTKKATELSEIKKSGLIDKAKDIAAGNDANLSDGELADLKYMEKLGLVPKSQLDVIIQKVKEEAKAEARQEIEASMTDKQKKDKLQGEITGLTDKYKFIKEQELKEFMRDRAAEGEILSPMTAAKIKYEESFKALGAKIDEQPAFDNKNKGRTEAPEANTKILELGSREMNDAILEGLTAKPVE